MTYPDTTTEPSYALEVLQKELRHIEEMVVKFEDLAAVCAKWLVCGVYIEHYGMMFQHRQAQAAAYKQKRDELRRHIDSKIIGT
jgi:hypothetical protein